jgi:hypothetical protein
MKKLAAFSAPILPGKTDQWLKFIGELNGAKSAQFKESRKKHNVRERTFLQKTPHGDFVIVTLKGDDPMAGFAAFASAHDEFTDWFVKEVQEIHGFNLREMSAAPMPEMIIDSGEV